MKRSYHHGDLKGALIKAGLDIIAESGIESLTIRSAAQKTGVSHAAPYRHFGSKDEFLVSIALDGFEKLASTVGKNTSASADGPTEKLAAICRAYITFAWQNREQYRIMFGPYIRDKVKHADFYGAYDRAFQRLKSVLEEYGRSRKGQQPDTSMTALAVWSLIHGYSMFLIDNYEDIGGLDDRQVDGIIAHIKRMPDNTKK